MKEIELAEFRFIGKDDITKGIKLPLSITKQLIPELIEQKYLKWEGYDEAIS